MGDVHKIAALPQQHNSAVSLPYGDWRQHGAFKTTSFAIVPGRFQIFLFTTCIAWASLLLDRHPPSQGPVFRPAYQNRHDEKMLESPPLDHVVRDGVGHIYYAQKYPTAQLSDRNLGI